jgi:hypothetical protein
MWELQLGDGVVISLKYDDSENEKKRVGIRQQYIF